MASPTHYKVEVQQEGRSGRIVYLEGGESLSFFWEYTIDGVGVAIPITDDWSAYCERAGAYWARGRREEILQNLAQALVKRYKKGTFELTDHWLNIHQGPSL